MEKYSAAASAATTMTVGRLDPGVASTEETDTTVRTTDDIGRDERHDLLSGGHRCIHGVVASP